jgi:hypothetical protein
MSQKLWNGKSLDDDTYRATFEEELWSLFNSWAINEAPSGRLKYLIGRYFNEYCKIQGEGLLSKSRIQRRGWNWRKLEAGGDFSITRHLGAWKDETLMSRVVQIWEFDLVAQVFTLKSTRNWEADDPDL